VKAFEGVQSVADWKYYSLQEESRSKEESEVQVSMRSMWEQAEAHLIENSFYRFSLYAQKGKRKDATASLVETYKRAIEFLERTNLVNKGAEQRVLDRITAIDECQGNVAEYALVAKGLVNFLNMESLSKGQWIQ
jgi:hypothetical protein